MEVMGSLWSSKIRIFNEYNDFHDKNSFLMKLFIHWQKGHLATTHEADQRIALLQGYSEYINGEQSAKWVYHFCSTRVKVNVAHRRSSGLLVPKKVNSRPRVLHPLSRWRKMSAKGNPHGIRKVKKGYINVLFFLPLTNFLSLSVLRSRRRRKSR